MTRALGSQTYAQFENALNTGDVFLFKDPAAIFASQEVAVKIARASTVSFMLSLLPCVSYEVVRSSLMGGDDGTDEENDSGTCALDFEGDFGDCYQAAIILLLVDETHTNPHASREKLLPYIFLLHSKAIVPLRDFIQQHSLKDASFAIRRLAIANENGQREMLRERLLSVYA